MCLFLFSKEEKRRKEGKKGRYNVYAYDARDGVVDYNPIYLEWGKTKEQRQENYRKDIRKEIERINFNARFLGSKEFIKKMEKEFKMNSIRENRGRPKKVNK